MRGHQSNGTGPLNPIRTLAHIEPLELWTIKILNKFNIITKDELAARLESYLDKINKVKANISVDTEKDSDEYLVGLEPTKWKEQDHYLVLGLQHLRYQATEDDIKRAHRRKALKHHPDKRKEKQKQLKTKKSDESPDDLESDYYSCITRAMDILGDPVKRRSFDSVDPSFDDSVPNQIKPQKLQKDPGSFYRIFGPAFDMNARWSVNSNVPKLGNEIAGRTHVENFYEFWYNFQSWREFSYLDEEDKEKGENRDERRWLDKQNKAARQQRKKAENTRLRQLVDNAYSCDPRIAKFKEEDKQKKLNIKKARQDEIRQRIEREEAEKTRLEEEEKAKKLAAEEEEKEKRLREKKRLENAKKETKKTIKAVEEIFKSNNYFVTDQKDKVKFIEDLDKLTHRLSLVELKEFKSEIEKKEDFQMRQGIFLGKVDRMYEMIEEEKKQAASKAAASQTNGSGAPKVYPWTEDEIKLLVKAVSLFPAGTKDRWDVIAKYMAQHSTNKTQRDAKQVLGKVKQIQEQLAKRRV